MDDKTIKILIIDDDEATRSTFAEVFRQEKFNVFEAKDGLSGLDMAIKEIPDVILTGIMMPKMDGFALKEALAKNVSISKIPVMMLSHMGREEDRERAKKIGIKDFIIKGMITPREVVEKIRAVFEASEYKIKFSLADLDAPKLAKDFYLSQEFKCPNCNNEMILSLKASNVEKKEFIAKLVCPKCE